MSEPPHRPNDHLVEPMFAALGRHGGDRAPSDAPTRRGRALRVCLWGALVGALAATLWFALFA